MDVSIVLPAYNEEENLRVLLPKIHEAMSALVYSYEILVCDTKEILDGTKEVCLQNNAKHVLRRGGNMYGDAIRTGFEEANGQYIIIMDCDGSHEPNALLPMLSLAVSGVDVVIGSRYVKGGNTDNNIVLKFMSFCVNIAYRIIFGLKIYDVSNSFRIYRADQVKTLKLECNNFDLVEEILIRLVMTIPNIKIVEHPISFRKRIFGKSKRNLVQFIFSYVKTIQRLYYIKLNS